MIEGVTGKRVRCSELIQLCHSSCSSGFTRSARSSSHSSFPLETKADTLKERIGKPWQTYPGIPIFRIVHWLVPGGLSQSSNESFRVPHKPPAIQYSVTELPLQGSKTGKGET